METDQFDYIVVGAGSAGAAAAARLSEDGQHSVLLLEAGPMDTHFFSRMPLGVAELLARGIYFRHFFTEPEAALKGRSIYWPRGWVVGGSSSVNGMIWVHGTPHIYDEWAADGCPGWGWRDLQPWFKKIESFKQGDPATRGHNGPVTITEFKPSDPLADAFLDGVQSAGLAPRVADFNREGFGGSYQQYNTRNGTRCNTRRAYLDPAKGRTNLTLRTGVLTTRVLIENGRAKGVVAKEGDREVTFHARQEVILCGGAFNSAQLLELSGIGRRDVLAAAGVPLVHELPMVGENLSEHVYSPAIYEAQPGVSWNKSLGSKWGNLKLGLQWLVMRNGPLSTNTITGQAFVPAQSGSRNAEIKLQIQQISSSNNRGKGRMQIDAQDRATLASFQIRPYSRGSCHIHNNDPTSDPRLVANHFSDPRDMECCLTAMRMMRSVASTPSMSQWLRDEVTPGKAQQSDESLIDYIRQTGATAYHPVGTCRIGSDPAQSVVDPQLRVHGIAGLRVADGSVMPSIASTNTNAICIVMGERVADFIAQNR